MKQGKLTMRSIMTLSIVAASTKPINAHEVHQRIEEEKRHIDKSPWGGLVSLASIGMTYGALQAHVNMGHVRVVSEKVRGKDVDCYSVTGRGRAVLESALQEIEHHTVLIRSGLGRSPA